MTWKEFVDSEYNPIREDGSTPEFSDVGDGFLRGDGANLINICKTGYTINERMDWTIVPNCSYEFN